METDGSMNGPSANLEDQRVKEVDGTISLLNSAYELVKIRAD